MAFSERGTAELERRRNFVRSDTKTPTLFDSWSLEGHGLSRAVSASANEGFSPCGNRRSSDNQSMRAWGVFRLFWFDDLESRNIRKVAFIKSCQLAFSFNCRRGHD